MWLMCQAGCCQHSNEGYLRVISLTHPCWTTMPHSAALALIAARLWFRFTSPGSAARLHTDSEEGDEVLRQMRYNQSFRGCLPPTCYLLFTSLLIKRNKSCKTNAHPSSGRAAFRGRSSDDNDLDTWWLFDTMCPTRVIWIEGPNEDFIRCLSNIMDHARIGQVKRDWINSIFHWWWDQFPISTRLIWHSK